MFLKNSQNTFIKKLLIRCRSRDTHDFILSYIKEYIMKKKRIKYLTVKIFNTDLFSLKDELKEFELYNIKIQKYQYQEFFRFKFIEELLDFNII
jgi:hypothetical protein